MIQTEPTPNPESLKFLSEKVISDIGTEEFQKKDRNKIDTADVDDVVLGCVAPVGEQGACIARTAVLNADYDQSVSGVQINRFCASGLEATNMAAAQVMSGQAEMSIGGVESEALNMLSTSCE